MEKAKAPGCVGESFLILVWIYALFPASLHSGLRKPLAQSLGGSAMSRNIHKDDQWWGRLKSLAVTLGNERHDGSWWREIQNR